MKTRNIIFIVFVLILIGIQFVRIDKTQPETDPDKDFIALENPPEEVKGILKNACYDCHSHHTKYPWYSNVAPASWLLGQHVKVGRKNVNFSTWGDYPSDKKENILEDMTEEVKEGHMPVPNYTWLHSEAQLSDQEREVLVNWVFSKI